MIQKVITVLAKEKHDFKLIDKSKWPKKKLFDLNFKGNVNVEKCLFSLVVLNVGYDKSLVGRRIFSTEELFYFLSH